MKTKHKIEYKFVKSNISDMGFNLGNIWFYCSIFLDVTFMKGVQIA